MSSRQYSPRAFLRQVPNQLLKQFFERRGHYRDLLWYLFRETEVELIYDAWQALPGPEREEVERTFRGVHELASQAGIKALVEEGPFHGVDLAAQLDAF